MYIWYSRSTCKTGRTLRQLLNVKGGIKPPPPHYEGLVFSWGARTNRLNPRQHARMEHARDTNSMTFINSPWIIDTIANKFTAAQKLIEANVNTPFVSTDIDEIDAEMCDLQDTNANYPDYKIMGRERYHSRGRNIRIYRSRSEIYANPSQYYSIFTPNIMELRCHVWKDKAMRTTYKVPSEDGVSSETIRSHDNGWVMRRVSKGTPIIKAAKREAVKAVNALGLDFGGVDVIITPDNTPVVLEVNTGMGLDNAGLEFYTTRIQELIDNET